MTTDELEHTNTDTNNLPNIDVRAESLEKDIPELGQCFFCAKKHLMRAKIFFEEYHTGYPSYIKHLFTELDKFTQVVSAAYRLYQNVMGQLDMSASELVGNPEENYGMLNSGILELANRIRQERLNMIENVLYVPKFDAICADIQLIQNKVNKTVGDVTETQPAPSVAVDQKSQE